MKTSSEFRPWGVILIHLAALLIAASAARATQEYYWSTFAGPAAGTGFADGPKAIAHFDQPDAIATDGGGNYYVADRGNNTIRKIDVNGNVTTLAGAPLSAAGFRDGKGVHARFNTPVGVAVDSGSNVYVADQGNFAVRKIAPDGTVTTFAGGSPGFLDGSGTAAQFSTLSGVALDSGSNVYVTDSGNRRIRKIAPDGLVTTLAGDGTYGYMDASGTNAEFRSPMGIAADSSDNLYVADEYNDVVREISPGGGVTTLAGAGPQYSGTLNGTGTNAELGQPVGLAVDGSNNVYVTEPNYDDLRKITPNGTVTTFTSLVQGGRTIFENPVGLAADASGNVYLADTSIPYIFKVLQSGSFASFAGASNQVGTNTNFEDLTAMTIDSGSNLYVADFDESAVLKITQQAIGSTFYQRFGTIYEVGFSPLGLAVDSVGDVFASTSFGEIDKINPQGGDTGVAGIPVNNLSPEGVALDSGTNIYVADPDNSSIQFVTLSGSVSTFAGGNGTGYTDGSGFRVRFNAPDDVALDGSGNVYVADTGNNAIRMITQAGNVSTVAGGGPAGYLDGTGTNARFSGPQRLTIDSAGNLFVADSGNEVVRMITPGGTVSTIGGSPGSYGSQPGLGTASLLGGVLDVCVDGSGNVYAATPTRVAIGVPQQVQTGSVQVMLSPTNAIASGAQWQVDGGPLQSSGAVVTGLLPGVHAIDFADVSLYSTPAGQDINIVANQTAVTSGTYVAIPQVGSLTVTLTPDAAIAAGAQWQVDGGPLQDSNATVVTFNPVSGFEAPSPQQVYVYFNETQSIEGDYTSIPTFQITPSAGANGGISPNTAQPVASGSSVTFAATPSGGYAVSQWLVNGTVAQQGGTSFTLTNVSADSSVEVTFASVTEFNFADSSTVVHNTDGEATVTVTRNFTGAGSVTYQTIDGTAVGGVEYSTGAGTLVFSGTQTQATINVPIVSDTGAAATTDFSIQLSNPSTGNVVGDPGSTEVYILNAHAGDLSLSQTSSIPPAAPPDSTGAITVNLIPYAAYGQWKLFGELNWRNSGDTATGLTSGNYEVEFASSDGYLQPAAQVVSLLAGEQAVVSGTYLASGTPATGSLQVTLAVPEGSGTGGWRFQGETAWRPSGETVSNLNTGNYILEFEPDAGLVTPPNCEAVVYAGEVATVNITYALGDSTLGLTPVIVSGSIAETQAPYDYVGQIQTDEGVGTGFVPLDRVVVTAAHVIFDDSALNYVSGVRWFPQYERGQFETPAQIPAGSYVLSGYAGQRALDNSPGVASAASRELDAAALYFLEPADRGGASGYLASDAVANPWLTGGEDKFIAGYPATGETPTGHLYATPAVQEAFENVTGSVFSTTAITSYPGNSGGPLFVRYSDGNFYPAAIYLGGSAETVVHAIDSQVIALMKEAEVTGNGGQNNSSGGIIDVSEAVTGNLSSALGSINVTLAPPGANAAGAYWEIGDGVKRYSGESVLGLLPNSYTVQFFAGDRGYSPPAANTDVEVTVGSVNEITATYTPNAPTITSGTEALAIEGQPFKYQIGVTPNVTTSFTSSTLPAGLTLNGTTGLISGTAASTDTAGVSLISLTATNAIGGASPFTLALTVAKPGALAVSMTGKGKVPKAFENPTIQAVGSPITIKATPAAGYVFAYWSDATTGAVLSTQQAYTFTIPSATPALDLQANFVTNPFTTAKGSYLALLQGGAYNLSGFAQVTVKANGSFASTFNIGGKAGKVSKTFNGLGQSPEFTLSGGSPFNGALSLTAGGMLSGTLSNPSDGSQIALNAERVAPRADEALAGTYTVVLPVASGTGSLPSVAGTGTLTVSKTGGIKFAGKLGDGLPVKISGALDSNGVWSFLFTKPTSKSAGAELLLGPVTLPPASNGTAGTLNWYRTPNVKDSKYPNGFSTQIPIVLENFHPHP
jgi:sugar lactone lactonase YvrE